jgi:tetratricopeptide (TPR) repeat protein
MDEFDLLRQNVKIVFTFREDYLAEFEGLKTLIRPIMQNRMRLAPMRGDRASEAIQQAGAGRLSAAVAARIVKFVGGARMDGAAPLAEISVEPALLSLVCRELNEQRIALRQTEISADLLQGENTQQIIAQFYSQGFAGLDARVRYFVEDRLLTAAGYRDSCALENALTEPGVSEEAIQTLVDRRILRREERGGLVRLELIHDVLAIVAKASRDARREAAALEAAQLLLAGQRRRQRIVAAWAAVLVAALVGVSWLAVLASRGKREAGAVSAEQLAKSKQLQLADALEKADAATSKATSEAAQKEQQRWRAVVWAAAADEQLDSHGTGEQLRACIDSTNRLNNDPPPPATADFMVGVWHVDEGFASTDMDWHSDGKCVSRHLYQNGQEIDAKNDVCTWKYKLIDEHDFEVDYQSKMLGDNYPKQLIFKILSPTRMRNTNIGYDAFRIICPAQELTIRRDEIANLDKEVNAHPGDLTRQADLANGFDKLGAALTAQNDSANALIAFNNKLYVYQNLEARDSGNKTWQQETAQSLEQVGDLQFAQAKTSNQAGNALESVKQVTAALASYQKSLVIREQLLHASPEDVDAQLNAAQTFNQLGSALYWSRHPAEAANAIRQAARLFQNIVDAHRDTPQIRVKLLWDLYSLSQMSDNKTEAMDDLRKSLAIATELDREHAAPDEMTGVVTFLQDALSKQTKQPTPPKPN